MSLNNINKRNLFEMKNQNRYAQLVEAQSPEPPEVEAREEDIEEDMRLEVDNMKTLPVEQINCPATEALLELKWQSSGEEGDSFKDDYRRFQAENNGEEINRKISLSNSQISTSFVSTVSDDAQQSTSLINSYSQSPTNNRAFKTRSDVGETNLATRISRSMLNLDQSVSRADKFEVFWNRLSFSYVPSFIASYKRKANHVLRDITGKIKSNQLVAVIGPSGCGKTTLLQFLAGNNSSQRDKLRIVGLTEPKVAFIGQGDCLLPGLTARETLIYASRLQNTQPNFDHQQHIQPILNALGLLECCDRSITKLSGGQAKRVTIAQELLYPTNLLILDEVTSGLDASTSYSIVKLLKQLVSDNDYPMSIVMSIHQPSAKLFAVFDQVYVMSAGCCIYEGSCQVDIVNEFLGRFGLECPKFHNIADYLIEIASDDLSTGTELVREQMIQFQQKRSQLLEDPTRSSLIEREAQCFIEQADESRILIPSNDSLYEAIERARNRRERPMFTHLSVHLSRSLLRIRRSYILTYLQLVTYILLGLQLATFYGPDIGTLSGCPQLPMSFIAFVFANTPDDNLTLEMRRIQENMNFLLVAIMTATFAALEITVITFPLEAKTVKREWRNGWYRVSSYFIGRTLADLPFQIAFVITFCVIIYTMTGQIGLTTWRFGSFVLIIVMTALIAQTVGFIFGALFMDNLPAAVFTAPLCIFPALLFSGFFSRVSQIPSFYKPMTYLSHFRYAFDALLVSLYGYDRCLCDQASLTSYHESLQNQTSTIKTMFTSLFGSVDCGPNPVNPEENSIEDTITSSRDNLIPALFNLTTSSTTPMPKLGSFQSIKPLEDALVDSVFEHMIHPSESSQHEGSAMDHLVNKFSTRVTSMLNSRSNFGHQVPQHCQEFNSYLMTEFDLHNNDLIFGLMMLFIVVLVTRLLCNAILTFTIATRTT